MSPDVGDGHTGVANPANPVYSYLLKGFSITRPDQVWSIDITYTHRTLKSRFLKYLKIQS
ncbi:hypothetical protein FACS1894187_17330 [Synergistales bacterium]|nr:hypothetical protein FACS1894187_17330 [Synergistales bacterium]